MYHKQHFLEGVAVEQCLLEKQTKIGRVTSLWRGPFLSIRVHYLLLQTQTTISNFLR